MAHFKKKSGGEFTELDLITLSFDKEKPPEEKPSLETFERLAAKHGKRKPREKKNGK